MTEKMHLSGLASPILHRPRVKEVKDANIREIYSSLLLSPLSPIPPCATRFGAILLRIYARVGERAKEAQIDAPNPFRAGRATLAQVRTSPAKSGNPTAAPARRRGAECQTRQGGQAGRGSFPANGDGDCGGNGLRRSFCLLRVARAACGRRGNEFCPAMPGT